MNQNITININDFVRALTSQSLPSTIKNDTKISEGFNFYLHMVKITFTPANYDNNLSHSKMLIKHLQRYNIESFNQINNCTIKNLIEVMRKNNNSNRTINMRITLLLRVHRYLVANNMINNYEFEFKKLKEKQPKITIINNDDLIRILEYAQNVLSDQSRLVLLILIGCGTRRTETSKIEINNIDYEENTVTLTETKTFKTKQIYLTDEMLALCKKISKNNTTYLFEKADGTHLTPNAVSMIIKRISKALDIKDLSPHKFRHAYATNLIRQGADIETVRKLMGHSSIEMTKRYFDITNEELKANALKFNPLNFLK